MLGVRGTFSHMASTVWKGYLSFGLISVPIRLHVAARSDRIGFNQLHKECHSRIRQRLYCPVCDRQVERSELVKGYEYEKDNYVLVEEEEVKKVTPQSGSTMEILEFVKLEEVDPLYFDSSFFAVPEEAGQKAYELLVRTMEEAGYAAVAKMSMHQREHTVLVRPRKNGLTLHTMHYPADIRQVAEYGQDSDSDVKPQEIKLARQLVESLAAPFDPDKYRDEFQGAAARNDRGEAPRTGSRRFPSTTIGAGRRSYGSLAEESREQDKKKPPARAAKAQPAAAASTGKPGRVVENPPSALPAEGPRGPIQQASWWQYPRTQT